MKELWTKITTFLAETRSEMKKVSFPSRQEVMSTTVVVIITMFVFAFYLWIVDTAIGKAYEYIYKALGS